MVDAAICLPMFIIAVAMLLQVINFVSKEETAYFNAETNIQAVGILGTDLDIGFTINDPLRRISIDHVQFYPIIENLKFPFLSFFAPDAGLMTMPFRTYIGESPDAYADTQVYIFPKNEGKESQGPKYHTKYCRTMKGGATKGLEVTKVGLEEAKSRGYTQCLWCLRDNE